jgi:uroporphyrinogen III methyltransferase/synthase
MEKTGRVYLVGAGPGDPGLITWKGLKLLQTCDAVIYDRLVSDRLLDYVREDCELIHVGKTVGSHGLQQEEINRIIIDKAHTCESVVRLKGGDPFVFGRGGEEVLALQEQGIPYEVIPGVTSAIAAATYSGIPITHRGSSQSFTVVTGHTAEEENAIPGELKQLAGTKGTLVILMGIGNLDRIREELLAAGKAPDTPAAVISEATMPSQREVHGTLGDIGRKVKEAKIKAPAVIILGEVAGLDMRATIRKPLSGVRVGITGTASLRHRLAEQLEALGAGVKTISALKLVESEDLSGLDTALQALESYRWLIFTSANAVEVFFRRLAQLDIDHRSLSHIRYGVVGSATKEALRRYGYRADLMPERYTVAELAGSLCEAVKPGERLLIPRAKQGSEELTDLLRQKAIPYEDVKIYDVTGVSDQEGELKQLNYLTFASSSGVHAFMQAAGVRPDSGATAEVLPESMRLVCIGEATEQALLGYGPAKVLTAEEASVRGLVECIWKDHERTKNEALHED